MWVLILKLKNEILSFMGLLYPKAITQNPVNLNSQP